jgi:hypothetical protein
VPGARLILTTDPRTREVTAVNPGQPVLDWPRNAPQKYSKCAYSTRFGLTVPLSVPTPAEGGLDGVISLSDDGRFFRVREQCFDGEVRDGAAYSQWRPWAEVELTTWLLAEPTGHLRIHRLTTKRKLWAIDAGFAVPYTDKVTRQLLADASSGPVVRAPAGASLLRPLLGKPEAECVDVGANGHLLASLSAMPILRSTCAPGTHWLATWVAGSADPKDAFADATTFAVEISGDLLRVTRAGAAWWTSVGNRCGESTEARKQALAQLV